MPWGLMNKSFIVTVPIASCTLSWWRRVELLLLYWWYVSKIRFSEFEEMLADAGLDAKLVSSTTKDRMLFVEDCSNSKAISVQVRGGKNGREANVVYMIHVL